MDDSPFVKLGRGRDGAVAPTEIADLQQPSPTYCGIGRRLENEPPLGGHLPHARPREDR